MARYLENVYLAFRQAIATVWPEVIAGGTPEDIQVDREPLDILFAQDAEGDTRFPFAVIHVQLREVGTWGLANHAHEGTVRLWYLAEYGAADEEETPPERLRGRLEAMRDHLNADLIGFGQVLDEVTLEWHAALPPNQYFAQMNKDALGGVVAAKYLVGETA